MAERLKQILDRILEIWKGWTVKQRTMIVSTVAVVVIALGIVVLVLNQPNYKVLTSCKDYAEIKKVTDVLISSNIKHKVDDTRMTVKVRKADLTAAKMAIASEDIQSDGYSFEDAMNSSFTTTESDKTKKYARYLESKFVSDLQAMEGVKAATVTVSIPESSSSFYERTEETSVAVTLDLSKSVNDEIAESIAQFLATSVGNKTTDSINIVSRDGTMLFSGISNASNNSGMSYAGKLKYKGRIEATVVNSMRQSLLAVGLYDDMYCTLNYDLDWDTVNTIATEYSTQGGEQAIYKHSYEEKSEGSAGAAGTPGTSSNDNDTTYEISNGYGNTSKLEIKDYDYCPNEIVTTTIKEPGAIIYGSSTLAVTFVKTMVYNQEECQKLGYLDDMTWDEFKSQNTQPVRADVDQEWIQLLSRGTGVPANNITVMAYQRPFFEDTPAGGIWKNASFWLQIVLAAVILLLLAVVVIRSARPLTVEEKEPELSVEEMLASTREKQPVVDDIDMNDKSETRKAIEKFVDENPEAVALLLRNWLNEGWN